MAPIRSFQDVLSAAITDILDHGFDSMERIERWKRDLTDAALRQAGDQMAAQQRLKDALAAIYRREVDQLRILRNHQGDVPRFTIDQVKPHLHAELDRRIRAGVNLIKLKRDEAIPQAMRRFEGWSTSVPPGGVSGEKKAKVKETVRKSIRSLPYEERRVAIDQGHKMLSALHEIVASDGGAIAVIWNSKWRQAGYDYRVDHKERDKKVYLIRDSWAHTAGLIKRGKVGYYDEVTAFGQEPFCSCYGIWLYNLRDLPEDMLTKEGRRKLVEVGLHTNASRAFARTDDATNVRFDARLGGAHARSPMIMQADAKYMPVWPNRPVRCCRCSMFQPGIDPRTNSCTAVAGTIARTGHCKLFDVGQARADSAEPEPVPLIGYAAMGRRLDRLQREVEQLSNPE